MTTEPVEDLTAVDSFTLGERAQALRDDRDSSARIVVYGLQRSGTAEDPAVRHHLDVIGECEARLAVIYAEIGRRVAEREARAS